MGVISGCATSSLTIQSNPAGADISVRKGDGSATKLGVTPLSITKETASDWMGDNVEISVSKDGYLPQTLLLPKFYWGAKEKLDVQLKDAPSLELAKQQEKVFNEIASGVAEVQHLLAKKDLVSSEQRLNILLNRFQSIAMLHTLLGNLFYMRHDFSKSLSEYKRAQQLQPEDIESKRMVEKLSTVVQGSIR
jgi:hypothetical protein